MLDTLAQTRIGTGPSRPDRTDTSDAPLSVALRDATQAAHDATEAAHAPFVNDPARHLRWFLCAQLIATRAMIAARDGAPCPEEGALLTEVLYALEDDCGSHGQAPLPDLPPTRPLDTLSVGYLTLGARLGTKVLAERVRYAGCDMPRAFTIDAPKGAWRAFRARLDQIDVRGARAARIAADANLGFDLHRAAAALAWGCDERRR